MADSETTPFDRLVQIMHRLRSPGGCPWDAEQTHDTLRPYLIEEAYETLDALDRGDDDDLRDELGDVLLQVVFHSELAAERDAFAIDDVITGLSDKLVRRHPHVFADVSVSGPDEVRRNWLRIKAEEREARSQAEPAPSALDGVPAALPALARAHRLGQKAATIGLDWSSADGVRSKLDEELSELAEAVRDGSRERIAAEIGDLLFTTASYARHLGVNAESCLQQTLARFSRRVRHVEAELDALGVAPTEAGADRLDAAWRRAKASDDTRD
jgi:MazG family protein